MFEEALNFYRSIARQFVYFYLQVSAGNTDSLKVIHI